MIVQDIVTNFEQIIEDLFPDWKRADYLYQIEKNHRRNGELRFGVRPLDAPFSDGTIRSVTFDHIFQVVLFSSFINKSKNDFAQREVLFNLYEKMHDITVAVHAKKVGLPSSVLLVKYNDCEEPEFLDGDDLLVVLRGNFTIKYRKPLT